MHWNDLTPIIRSLAFILSDSRRQGTSPWNFLGRDTQSPYVDTTPLAEAGKPEIREYRIRGVIDDVEIGDYSPTRQITVT